LPYVISKRPEWDKFAGAVYSIAFDTVFPDGRTLQIGTAHDLGQNFSKAFGISFERENGTRDYVWQTSYGISERVIAAVIAIHGDDRGLVLPPSVAPIQIVVIPIPYKGSEEEIIEKSKEIAEKLKINGFRTQLDLREKLTPGSKYFEWELRGVPLRIEIGPRDLKEGTITLVRRDTLEKKPVKVDGVIEEAKIMLQNIEKNLKEQASAWLKNKIHDAESLEAAKVILEKESGIIELGWCGNDACGLKFEEKIDAKVLGTPADGKKLSVKRKCPICGEEAKFIIRLAKTY
jgi:prolyl-tRNA synthetase